jgi:hypothetical protein
MDALAWGKMVRTPPLGDDVAQGAQLRMIRPSGARGSSPCIGL